MNLNRMFLSSDVVTGKVRLPEVRVFVARKKFLEWETRG